jgi:seryl-tRNA synthetase
MAERQTMLKSTYDSIEEVPEEFRSLYSDVNGTVRLVGIAGVKTQADIDTLTKSLNEERLAHKATKERLSVWGDLKHEEVMQKLDKLPALEAASEGKFDEAAIEAAASKRAEGAIKMALGPVQRKADENAKKLEEALAEVQNLREEKVSRTISDEMRKAMAEAKVIPEKAFFAFPSAFWHSTVVLARPTWCAFNSWPWRSGVF